MGGGGSRCRQRPGLPDQHGGEIGGVAGGLEIVLARSGALVGRGPRSGGLTPSSGGAVEIVLTKIGGPPSSGGAVEIVLTEIGVPTPSSGGARTPTPDGDSSGLVAGEHLGRGLSPRLVPDTGYLRKQRACCAAHRALLGPLREP